MTNELHRRVIDQADKLDREYEILDMMRERAITDASLEPHVAMMLAQTKRVRRESTLLVRALAQLRDDLQP